MAGLSVMFFRKFTAQYTLQHCHKIRSRQLYFQKKYFHRDPTMQKRDYEYSYKLKATSPAYDSNVLYPSAS